MGWYVTAEWHGHLWRGDSANFGVIVMDSDKKYIDCMFSPDGGHEDKRIAAFFEMASTDALVRSKESLRRYVDEWRKRYFDDPHDNLKKRSEFIYSMMKSQVAKLSIYGAYELREPRLVVTDNSPSEALVAIYKQDVAWPPDTRVGTGEDPYK